MISFHLFLCLLVFSHVYACNYMNLYNIVMKFVAEYTASMYMQY